VQAAKREMEICKQHRDLGNGDKQAAKRDWRSPTRDLNTWLCGR